MGKCLVDGRGQRKIARLVRADRKTTVTQITTCYYRDMQGSDYEHPTCRILKQMGYSSIGPHRVPLLPAKKQETEALLAHQNQTMQHSDGRVRKQHENMDPSCPVSTLQAGGFLTHFVSHQLRLALMPQTICVLQLMSIPL